MTKVELSLLLFLECRQVDNCGRVDIRHMNEEDLKIAKKWNETGYVRFGRLIFKKVSNGGSHWCKLSDNAHADAAKERQARAKRVFIFQEEAGE